MEYEFEFILQNYKWTSSSTYFMFLTNYLLITITITFIILLLIKKVRKL
jgi:hypothetical protein